MSPQLKDTMKRAARTFLQAFVGVMVVMLIPWLLGLVEAAGESDGRIVAIDVNFFGNVLIAGIAAGVVALVSFLHNVLEDNTPVQILPK